MQQQQLQLHLLLGSLYKNQNTPRPTTRPHTAALHLSLFPQPCPQSHLIPIGESGMERLFLDDDEWKKLQVKKGSGGGGGGGRRDHGSGGKRRRRSSMTRSLFRRCASLVKEQRARFYIVRRCVVMLVCWRD